MFATSSETEYLEPVYPGDRITATSVLAELTRKRLSVGDGAFFLIETTYTKQTGEVVGIERLTSSGTPPSRQRPLGPMSGRRPDRFPSSRFR